MALHYHTTFFRPADVRGRQLQIGDHRFSPGDSVGLGELGELPARAISEVATAYRTMAAGAVAPPLAALTFLLTGQPRALDGFFPMLRTLDDAERQHFRAATSFLAESSYLDLRLYDDQGRLPRDEIPPDVAYMVAGQIVEIFWARPDILERLFSVPQRIWIYSTPQAYSRAGGVAGGCYDSREACVRLQWARIYEGFYGPQPEVSPFLHEFGHLLDHFDAETLRAGPSTGFLPGMRPSDGAIYTPAARAAFLRGKQLELERSRRFVAGARTGDTPPIGHPYVLQNNTEFIAGYLEMFFRNPHAFAEQNRDLFDGFALLFNQDPRTWRDEDFPKYVRENRAFYASGQRPPEPGITVGGR